MKNFLADVYCERLVNTGRLRQDGRRPENQQEGSVGVCVEAFSCR